MSRFIAAASEIAKEAKALLRMLGIPARELRGVGLSVSSTFCSASNTTQIQRGALPGARQSCTAPPMSWASDRLSALDMSLCLRQLSPGAPPDISLRCCRWGSWTATLLPAPREPI